MRGKIIRRRLLGIAGLLLAVALLTAFLSPVLVSRSHYDELRKVLYEDPADTYEVLFVGGSHMGGAIDPLYLRDTYGLSSFNTATGGQEFYTSYYLLREALERQHPKVVVLDVWYALHSAEYGEPSYTYYALSAMEPGLNRIQAVTASFAPENRGMLLWPLQLFHNTWNVYKMWEDARAPKSPFVSQLGYSGGTDTYGGQQKYDDWTYSVCTPLADKQEVYLQRFFALAKEKNFQLLLINFPTEMEDDSLREWAGDAPGKLNQLAKEAKAAGVPFLNLNRPDTMQAMGFDYPTMMNNASHVNRKGAAKVGDYLMQYLQEQGML